MMNKRTLHMAFATVVAMGMVVPQATSLTIVRNFGGGTASNTAGGGTLQTIFNAAADCWEAAILDTHTVSLNYSWAALGGGTLGVHQLVSQGGVPHRETAATIRFDQSTAWFTDATPLAIEEYNTYTETTANLGGGNMIVGRNATGATGSALGRFDLFTVALHEIGHSLGLSGANTAFQAENGNGQINITGPRPFAGAAINTVSGAHLNLSNALMFPSVSPSERNLFSHADILANAQISQFTNLNLNAHPVPEPASMVALALGVGAFLRRRKAA